MTETQLTANETMILVNGSIQKFELKRGNQWLVYHVIPYQGFIVEKTIEGPQAFPEIIRIKFNMDNTEEWLTYYQKLESFAKKCKDVQVTTRRRINKLQVLNGQKIKN